MANKFTRMVDHLFETYGPAQGMYNMFYAFSRGYMVSQYPETREWIKV